MQADNKEKRFLGVNIDTPSLRAEGEFELCASPWKHTYSRNKYGSETQFYQS
jgi:hypothetical protein